jgi:uncharacterized protein (DUF169 family)
VLIAVSDMVCIIGRPRKAMKISCENKHSRGFRSV